MTWHQHLIIQIVQLHNLYNAFNLILQTPHQQTDKLDLHKYPDHISAGGGFGPVRFHYFLLSISLYILESWKIGVGFEYENYNICSSKLTKLTYFK